MKFLSLFSGIGGFDLGLERAGMQCVGQVEKDEYCLAVLAHHWPAVKRIADIYDVTESDFGTVDLICGGFPCQPFSLAGKRKGAKDDRYIWPEMCRVIKAYRPTWVLGENVAGMIGVELDKVLSDLEACGYQFQPFIIPACAVDAWHERKRVWVVAHSDGTGFSNGGGLSRQAEPNWRSFFTSDTNGESMERVAVTREECVSWPAEPDVGRVVHGLSAGVDSRERLRALGNAVVPQVVEEIGRAIMNAERTGTIIAKGIQQERADATRKF